MVDGKIYGILPDIIKFPGEEEDKWSFVIDEDYFGDDGFEHKLLIAMSDRMQVNVNESGVFISVPVKYRDKVEKILEGFKSVKGFEIETTIDDVGETFDININIDYETKDEDDCDECYYIYDESDVVKLEELIKKIYNVIQD